MRLSSEGPKVNLTACISIPTFTVRCENDIEAGKMVEIENEAFAPGGLGLCECTDDCRPNNGLVVSEVAGM